MDMLPLALGLFKTTLTDRAYLLLLSVVSTVVLAVVLALLLLRRTALATARELRARDERFRMLADTAPVMIRTIGPDGGCTWVNRRWIDFTGLELPEHLGRGWAQAVHGEDRLRYDAAYHARAERGESFVLDYRLRRHDGEYHWIRDNSVPLFDSSGRLCGYAASCIDISDLVTVERQLRQTTRTLEALVRTSPLAICCFDREGTIRIWNAAAERMFGWASDRVVGRRAPGVSDEMWGRFQKAMRQALENGDPGPIETTRRRKDGNLIHIESWVGVLRDFDAGGDLFISVIADVTDRRRVQDEIHAAMEAAEAASHAKDRFLAVLSHELRTPLTPVLATVSEMRRQPGLPAEMREDIDLIERNIRVEARLIDDLLDLTRIASGKLSLDLTSLDAHEIIEDAVRTMRADAEEAGVDLRVNLAAGGAIVRGDSTRLRQVIWNLLKNAIKFTAPGGWVRLRTEVLPYRRLLVEVSDNGSGIVPEVIPRLFHPFEQGGAEVTRTFGGLGLGLAISSGLADAMGGVLTGHSEGLGRGSSFSLELPLASEMDKPAPPEMESPPATGRQTVERGLRILLVEDHPDTRKVMSRLLSRRYRVTSAESVDSALRAVEAAAGDTQSQQGTAAPFDLLISDVGLPDGSGLELMRALRERYHLLGIALSGFGTEKDVRDSLDAGFSAHLTKPVDINSLHQVIAQVV